MPNKSYQEIKSEIAKSMNRVNSLRKRPTVRQADLYLCRELQRKNEYTSWHDLANACYEKYEWVMSYSVEIAKEIWKDYGN